MRLGRDVLFLTMFQRAFVTTVKVSQTTRQSLPLVGCGNDPGNVANSQVCQKILASVTQIRRGRPRSREAEQDGTTPHL